MVAILSCCCIGDSESLQVINLSWNHLRRKGAEAIAESIKVMVLGNGDDTPHAQYKKTTDVYVFTLCFSIITFPR